MGVELVTDNRSGRITVAGWIMSDFVVRKRGWLRSKQTISQSEEVSNRHGSLHFLLLGGAALLVLR
jgi:hypothetical protein